MFVSSADVFRTRQAVHDLLEVVRLHRDALKRIGASSADASLVEAIVQGNGVIPDEKTRPYSAILLAAALPDEDFNAFIVATAILVADRLQRGGGHDDLYWNYEAFRDHYRLADAPVRAALMNGFRVAHRSGKSTLPDEPDAEVCLTRQEHDVLHILGGEGLEELEGAILSKVTPIEAGHLWQDAMTRSLSLPERAGFRYLYERSESLAPTEPESAILIPWA